MTKQDFYKLWKDSSREDILNQYYYDYKYMRELIDRYNRVTKQIKVYKNCLDKEDIMQDTFDDLLYLLNGDDEE